MSRCWYVLTAILLVLPSCGKSGTDDELARRCERALAKVGLDELDDGPGATAKPSGDEQAIIDAVRKASQASCVAEGLTKEQAACFEQIKDIESLLRAADCPAIAAKRPSWFRVPPPELRREDIKKLKADDASGVK